MGACQHLSARGFLQFGSASRVGRGRAVPPLRVRGCCHLRFLIMHYPPADEPKDDAGCRNPVIESFKEVPIKSTQYEIWR